MSLLLRKIRKSRWRKDDPELTWLAGDIPADPLVDLNVSVHCLSVYALEKDRSNLRRVVAAIAAKANNPSNFDFMIFDEAEVVKLAIALLQTPGSTSDPTVNAYHRDLFNVTAGQPVELARGLWKVGERGRFQEAEVKKFIREYNLDSEKP